MAHTLPTRALLLGCLAIAICALTLPDNGLAHERRADGARSPHRRLHHGSRHRRRTGNAKQTSARHATKETSAKSRHGSGVPPDSRSSSTSSPPAGGPSISNALPDESVPARSPVAETPAELGGLNAPVVEYPTPSAPPESPAPEDPVESAPAKEPASPPAEEPETPITTKEPAGGSTPASPRKLIWSDEFNGSAGSAPGPDWNFDTGGDGWGEEELQSYTARPANAALNGEGDLAITARAEKYKGADGIERNYTSARLQTLEKFEFQYGLVEASIKVPAGQGLVAQFWALGDEAYEREGAWPGCGEIDTMEVLGSEPDTVNGTLHAPWAWAPTGVQGQAESPTPLSAGFHTYAVEWEPERISFML